jgi:hypothetical protein
LYSGDLAQVEIGGLSDGAEAMLDQVHGYTSESILQAERQPGVDEVLPRGIVSSLLFLGCVTGGVFDTLTDFNVIKDGHW